MSLKVVGSTIAMVGVCLVAGLLNPLILMLKICRKMGVD